MTNFNINGSALKIYLMSKVNHYEHMKNMGLILDLVANAKIQTLNEIIDIFNLEKIDEEIITHHTEI
jgi:hypothetical protein